MSDTGFRSRSDKKKSASSNGLSPKELASLDQMEAGLRDGHTAPEPKYSAPKPQTDLSSAQADGEAPTDGSGTLAERKPAHRSDGPKETSLSAMAGGTAPTNSISAQAGGKAPADGSGMLAPAKAPANSHSLSGLAGGQAPKDGSGMLAPNKPAAPSGGASTPKGNFLQRHRKLLLGGGGIGALLLSLLFGFFTLLPLKLTAITKTIEKHEVARVDDYVSRRIDAVIFRYLFHAVTGTEASDGFYTGNGIIRTLYGNMKLNNFEGKLAEKGITVTKTGPNSIRFVASPGAAGVDINSADDFVKYINTDLKGQQARKAIKLIVNDSYHPLQFLRRRHMRKYIMNAYNIRKWAIKKQEDTKDPNNPDLPGSTVLDVQSNVIDPPAELTASSIECVFGAPCPDPNVRSNPDGTSTFRPAVPIERNAGEQDAIDSTKTGIRDSYKAIKASATKTLEAGLSKIVGPTVTNVLFKAVPIVGWLALAADLDHFFWDASLIKLGIMLHSAQYVSVATTWASLADQAKAGQLTASQINQLNIQLNDIEKSNAMQRIVFSNPDGGTKLPDDKRVGSDDLVDLPPSEGFLPCDIGWLGGNLATNPPSGAAYWTFLYRQVMAFPIGGHTELCVLHQLIDSLAGLINFFFGDAINFLVQTAVAFINATASTLTGTTVDIMKIASDGLLWMMGTIWTPVASGRETGAALGNAMDAGWDVSANQMCRDALGCKNISNTVAYDQQTRIAAENRADIASRGLLASLFSIESPQTLGSQLIVMIPSTPASVVDRLNSAAFAMVANPFHFFGKLATGMSAPARAAINPNREPNGVQQTGYEEAEMADSQLHVATQDKAGPPGPDGKYTGPDGRVDQYDCDQIPDATVPNQCLIDTAAAQVLCSSLSSNDDGGLGGNGTPGDCGDAATPPSAYNPSLDPLTTQTSFWDNFQSYFGSTFGWNMP